jgi:hypothetical protein
LLLFHVLWNILAISCLLFYATFLKYPNHTFFTFQRTNSKTFVSIIRYFHEENVDNIHWIIRGCTNIAH